MTQFTTQCGHFYTIGLRPLACGVGVIWEEEGGREKREKKRGTDLTTEGGRGGGAGSHFSRSPPRLRLLRRLSDFTHFIFAFSEISCMPIDQQH